jgi:hypothetical protein
MEHASRKWWGDKELMTRDEMIDRASVVKTGWIQVRATDELRNDAKIVADLRGLSVSALVHTLLRQAIREEKEREPRAFTEPPRRPDTGLR